MNIYEHIVMHIFTAVLAAGNPFSGRVRMFKLVSNSLQFIVGDLV